MLHFFCFLPPGRKRIAQQLGMYSSKLIEIVQALDKSELRKLTYFLSAPYFVQIKQKEKAVQLFNLLVDDHPAMKNEQLQKEKAFAHLFPEAPYSGNKMDKLMARLLKAIKKFIVFEYAHLQDNEVQEELNLIRFYREKDLIKPFQQSIQRIKKKQRGSENKNMDFYFQQYQIEKEVTNQASLYNQRKGDLNLPNTLKSLDAFYLIAKLEYACWSLAQGISVALEVEHSLLLLDGLLEVLPRDFLLQYPLIGLYNHAYQLLRKGADKEILENMASLLRDSEKLIPREQLQALQAIYRSFMVRGYNLGEESIAEVFELYKAHLAAGYLYHNGGIFPGMVRNIVAFGLKAKAYAWIKVFLKDHRRKIIGTKMPDKVYSSNMAAYYFAQKKYDETLRLLQEYGEDAYYKIAAKRLELKVFFEIQDDQLEGKMTAFKVYIHRIAKKNLPHEPYQRNNNFINLLRQTNSPQVFKNPAKIEKLIGKIKTLGAVAEREWLLEKLEDLR